MIVILMLLADIKCDLYCRQHFSDRVRARDDDSLTASSQQGFGEGRGIADAKSPKGAKGTAKGTKGKARSRSRTRNLARQTYGTSNRADSTSQPGSLGDSGLAARQQAFLQPYLSRYPDVCFLTPDHKACEKVCTTRAVSNGELVRTLKINWEKTDYCSTRASKTLGHEDCQTQNR